MADTYAFYIVQAEAARRSAAAATLDNVRENFERAEGVWRSLADKAQRVADARQQREDVAAVARAEALAATQAANDAADDDSDFDEDERESAYS
jgi:hypothetical protein